MVFVFWWEVRRFCFEFEISYLFAESCAFLGTVFFCGCGLDVGNK